MKTTIVGGGITGLTTAIALKKLGIETKVYEKTPQLGETGAGIMLQPNAMKVLNHIGIGEAICDVGKSIDQFEIADQQLKPYRQLKTNFDTTKIIAIHRARLHKVLYDALPSDVVSLNQEYLSHQQNENLVSVEFSNAKVETQILLGADGIHSNLAKQLFNAKSRYSGQTCWRGIAHMSLPADLANRGKECWGENIRFGFVSISDTEVYWFAVAMAPEHQKDEPAERKAMLMEKYKNFHPLIHEIIQNTDETKMIRNDISDLERLNCWYKDSICLLGDAAHATTPNMGQGACQGIEDAYYISRALSSNDNLKAAFLQFEQERRKKVDHVVNNSWRFGQMAHRPLGRRMVKTIMKLSPTSVLQNQLKKVYSVDGLS